MSTQAPQKPESPHSEWKPSEFLLRGRYCPRSSIYELLEEARVAAGASAALILAADEEAMLRSLCFQAPICRGTPLDLVGVLRSSSDLNDSVDYPGLILGDHALDLEPSSPPFPWSYEDLLSALAALVKERGNETLAEWLRAKKCWVPARVPKAVMGARIGAALIFREPAEEMVQEELDVRTVAADDFLTGITERINATAQADVRRDAAIMASLDNELDPADYAESTVDLEQAAKSLVKLAVKVSRSDVGACYVIDHGAKALRRVAFCPEDGLTETYPERLERNSRSLANRSFSKRKAIQLPPGLPGETSEATYLWSDPDCRELATPIVGPLASPKAPAVGVLTVGKLNPEDTPYGAYDLALLRNISLRLALINATANSEEAARTFARLSTRATAQIRNLTSEDGRFRRLRLARQDAETPATAPLPDDLSMTLDAVQEGLETLGRVTGSHSATFRAALPSASPTGAHGLTLRRIAAYPRDWLSGEGELQDEAEGGVNWRVALTGQPHYVPVVSDADVYLRRRKETLSELCVPVLVEGRVVGVVNLESGSRNAYDALVTTAQAFAAHVGLAIADARIAIASALHDYAMEIVRRGHELGGEPCRSLRKLSKRTLPGARRTQLLQLADDIELKAKGLRKFSADFDAGAEAGKAFPALVEEELAKAELVFVDVNVEEPETPWATYSAGVTDIVRHALWDILVNVKRHSTKDRRRAQLVVHQGMWGGERHDVLTVTNPTSSPLAEIEAVNVYRGLLARESPATHDQDSPSLRVPQLGAYLAGSMARRVGGDVHLSQDRSGKTRVTLSIPSNPKPHGWATA